MGADEATRTVVLIGYGEVGRAFGALIEASSVNPIYVDPIAGEMDGIRTILGALPARFPVGSLVLGAVPSAAAVAVAKDVASRKGPFLYVDLSSSAPSLMTECAKAFDKIEADFVDGAIMGSVDLTGGKTPIVLSGPKVELAEQAMRSLGFNARALPDSVAGDACGVKLLRSLMTKGMEALAIECFAAAKLMGLATEIRSSLADICARPFPDLLDAMVRTHVIHASRRQQEVEAALRQAKALGLKAPVTEAVLAAYRCTAARVEAEKPKKPRDTDAALAWLTGAVT